MPHSALAVNRSSGRRHSGRQFRSTPGEQRNRSARSPAPRPVPTIGRAPGRRPGPADHRSESLVPQRFHQLVRARHRRFAVVLMEPVAGRVVQPVRFAGQRPDQQGRPTRVGRRIDVRHRVRQQTARRPGGHRRGRDEHHSADRSRRPASARPSPRRDPRTRARSRRRSPRPRCRDDPRWRWRAAASRPGRARRRPDRRPRSARPRSRPTTNRAPGRAGWCCAHSARAR